MGADQSLQQVEPTAVPGGLLVFDQRYVTTQPTTFHLREKIMSWSGDDFSVKDVNTNTEWFKVDGKALSIGDYKRILDAASGALVFGMRQVICAWAKTQNITDSNDLDLFQVAADFGFMSRQLRAVVPSTRGKQGILLKCDGTHSHGAVFYGDPSSGGTCVAKIYRPVATVRSIFGRAQDYYVAIAPNIDAAVIVALCISLDELRDSSYRTH